MSTKREVVRTVVSMATGAVLFCAGVYVARALPNGSTKGTLSFAGTLTNGQDAPLPGQHVLSFVLQGPGGAEVCSPPPSQVDVDKNGSFTAEIDVSGCKGDPFDGRDLTVEIWEGSTKAGACPVNPVPYAKYADKVGSADCPVGYERNTQDPNLVPGEILCVKGGDEIVKVGAGASAFWIDRYEASVWSMPDGSGTRFFKDSDNDGNILGLLPKNGQWAGTAPPAFAVSKKGVIPSRHMTWFQASTLCRASGKRLPQRDEWLEAARGTIDPPDDGTANENGTKCNIYGGGPRSTGSGLQCTSAWGAQDMIGNLWEWTEEWYAGLGDTTAAYAAKSPWGDPLYNGDSTWNVAGSACIGGACPTNLPAAGLRGGSWIYATQAGIFTLSLGDAPAYWASNVGLRCVLPR
ncbi:MAG: SUMF1/EgtB/PvdO family nonheme iron enzyme [Byssovorax sp.]